MSVPDNPDSSPGPEPLAGVSPSRLVDAAISSQVRQNRDRALQLELYAEMERRCQADHDARKAAGLTDFNPSPAREAGVEMGGALGISEYRVLNDLHLRSRLLEWFPAMWRRCRDGRLDLGRAKLFVDAAEQLAHEDDIPLFAASVEAFFERYDDPDSPLCTLSYDRLARAARYRRLKFEQRSPEASFGEAFKKRRVWLRVEDNGTAALGVTGAAHELQACDYRITLIARKRCAAPDEERTLDQMRADTALDLLLGRLTVDALDSELEQDETSDGHDPGSTFHEHEVGRFARPVVNLTVPVTTLMGASDEPGMLGGDPIPADLARIIAHDENATWYRLLTDPAGNFLDLSTVAYTPTAPIWRHVTARDQLCVWPGCRRPAARCEKDHRVPFPSGPTSTLNLDDLCSPHHRMKHIFGYHVRRRPDGRYEVTTPRGTQLVSAPLEQPFDGLSAGPDRPGENPAA
ncbi:MAG TPA: DUF222 domain-containing protein [Nocardioides sp.]|nr:DUF222 domain-containing protein [Nocardioides sp.]